jgi:hypothetical protein
LNDEQVAKIKEQQKNLHEQLKTVRENEILFSQQKKEQIKQIKLQHQADIKSVLTADQQKTFEQQKHDFHFNNRQKIL